MVKTTDFDRFFDTVETFITAGTHGGTYRVSWGPGFTNPQIETLAPNPVLVYVTIALGAAVLLLLLIR